MVGCRQDEIPKLQNERREKQKSEMVKGDSLQQYNDKGVLLHCPADLLSLFPMHVGHKRTPRYVVPTDARYQAKTVVLGMGIETGILAALASS